VGGCKSIFNNVSLNSQASRLKGTRRFSETAGHPDILQVLRRDLPEKAMSFKTIFYKN